MTTLQTKPVIFISYAHEDEPQRPADGFQWLSFVTGFLKPAERKGAVEIWTDRVMPGGADWVAKIERKLRACDIFVLLVSRYSMASDFVVDKEIRVIRERQARAEDVHLYPLLLTPTPEIALDEVRDKNMRPLDAKPFSDFLPGDQFREMNDAANDIVKISKEIAARKSEMAAFNFRSRSSLAVADATLRLSIENVDRLPDGGPLRVEVKGRGLDLGRDAHLDWTLPDPSRAVSSKHCEIRFRDGGYWLHDISTNGTFVNGAQYRLDAPYLLRGGDRLNIGPYVIAVSVEERHRSSRVDGGVAPKPALADIWGAVGEAAAPELRGAYQVQNPEKRPPDFLDFAEFVGPRTPSPRHPAPSRPSPDDEAPPSPPSPSAPTSPAILRSPLLPFSLTSPATVPSREKGRRKPKAQAKTKKPAGEGAAIAAAASSAPEPAISSTLPPNPRMIGRQDRSEELVKAILLDDRPIVVPGALGMGKTTLVPTIAGR
jgi:pSer/pThr/pTyr-binding forkhead associated (FHA) protein